ncbi:DUF2017 family protein [Streptomyces sp. AC495_CC817]|uniref:DUF2017 family protein n=1 Tax=Streptomyces sp. AC495_CC817 TaxID=2823900 RepID=UPI001C276DC4|nr:DUF2017 family protein [Streptomyces sp. AC495_CC817]
MSGRRVTMRMAPVEAHQLTRLLADLREVLSAPGADPAVDRLAPDPYPEDAAAGAEYREATRVELLDRRATDAALVEAALAPMSAEAPTLSERDALTERTFAIDEDAVDAWMRTLTALRLVIATRIGIRDDDDHDEQDPRFHMYDWLGYRLELLVQAADELL